MQKLSETNAITLAREVAELHDIDFAFFFRALAILHDREVKEFVSLIPDMLDEIDTLYLDMRED